MKGRRVEIERLRGKKWNRCTFERKQRIPNHRERRGRKEKSIRPPLYAKMTYLFIRFSIHFIRTASDKLPFLSLPFSLHSKRKKSSCIARGEFTKTTETLLLFGTGEFELLQRRVSEEVPNMTKEERKLDM